MTDAPFDAFLFEYSRPDANSPGGMLKVRYMAVKQSLKEARKAVVVMIGRLEDVRLVDSGPAVLRDALERGFRDGDARAL
jgi:hypothetical protein